MNKRQIMARAYDNVAELVNAGYPVGAVLCEGTFANAAKSVSVVMAGADPARTIRHFLDHLKLNPSKLRNLEIVSSDAFIWANMDHAGSGVNIVVSSVEPQGLKVGDFWYQTEAEG